MPWGNWLRVFEVAAIAIIVAALVVLGAVGWWTS